MDAHHIRQTFLDFFKSKEHAIVPSAPLMPTSPNLLFTNAGMNPFVPCFLEERQAPAPRVADTQKCIRAGGKHNDLEDVGFDTYHHTFFEMLGNWSFGNYFKKEAIEWAWELLTRVWGLPKERLYATVYTPGKGDPSEADEEAYGLWANIFEREGLDPKVHISRFGAKDNFWMMGDTGPCGPCSEIHMDLTLAGDTQGKLVNQGSPWCMELWNLVFIQFNATADGRFVPLPNKHVDTGMGLERVAGIQAQTRGFKDFSQKPSNYASSLFTPIFDALTALCGHAYQASVPEDRDALTPNELKDFAFRVIADHLRALSFSIADGIMPSNEGRGYVLRRILRRAVLFGQRLGLEGAFLESLLPALVKTMGKAFPELLKNQDLVGRVLAAEEASFRKTLDRGLELFERLVKEHPQKLPGQALFTLYDTYGFPVDLTALLAKQRGVALDEAGFEAAMQEQRQRARAAQVKTVIEVQDAHAKNQATHFVGYDASALTQHATRLLGQMQSQGEYFFNTESTPFYAEMGGQVGDQGVMTCEDHPFIVLDTQKDVNGVHWHRIPEALPPEYIGKSVTLSVDTARRQKIAAHHSATHLLNWALRQALGEHIHQAGSAVTPHGLRFDFSHFEAVSKDILKSIERKINEKILENHPIRSTEVPFSQKPKEALAFFGEKYGDHVRVVDIGGYSIELCAGTHVPSTGHLGLFLLDSEGGIAAGTRRIEARVGMEAYQQCIDTLAVLEGASARLNCTPDTLNQRLEQHLEHTKAQAKTLQKLEDQWITQEAKRLAALARPHKGQPWLLAQIDEPKHLRPLAVQILNHLGSGAVLLVAPDDKLHAIALATPEAQKVLGAANTLLSDFLTPLGGKGGGKPDMASGSAPLAEGLKNYMSTYQVK